MKAPKALIDNEVRKIISRVLNKIKIRELQSAAIRSLTAFYNAQYREISTLFGGDVEALLLVIALSGKNVSKEKRRQDYQKLLNKGYNIPSVKAYNYGVPNREYMKDYLEKRVTPVLQRLSEQRALDPDDVSGRNSLRNRAEMEVRYARHKEDLARLRAAGVKLVIISAHADCSKRCAPYQGKVYSLDGTFGTTDDGRSYSPIETATENPRDRYVTKAGKVYQNGLFGFNCRHYAIPYKTGYRFPKPDAKEERRQYKITETQRALERTVRKYRIKAIENKGINEEIYEKSSAAAKEAYQKYMRFSKANGRAYYPSRVELKEPE